MGQALERYEKKNERLMAELEDVTSRCPRHRNGLIYMPRSYLLAVWKSIFSLQSPFLLLFQKYLVCQCIPTQKRKHPEAFLNEEDSF